MLQKIEPFLSVTKVPFVLHGTHGEKMSNKRIITNVEAAISSFCNKKEIENAQMVSCYFCCNVYPSSQIKHFVDSGATAICPICGIDSVLDRVVPQKELRDLSRRMFSFTNESRKDE